MLNDHVRLLTDVTGTRTASTQLTLSLAPGTANFCGSSSILTVAARSLQSAAPSDRAIQLTLTLMHARTRERADGQTIKNYYRLAVVYEKAHQRGAYRLPRVRTRTQHKKAPFLPSPAL